MKTYHLKDFLVHERVAKEIAKAGTYNLLTYLDVMDGRMRTGQDILQSGETIWDYYGVWFCGAARLAAEAVAGSGRVFLAQKKIDEGEHDVSIYGIHGRMFYWVAQGYHRGIVLAEPTEELVQRAREIMVAAPWNPQQIYSFPCRGLDSTALAKAMERGYGKEKD